VKTHPAAGRLQERMPGTHLDVPHCWQVNRLAAEQLPDPTRAVVAAAREWLVG
jgi:hypothetical protein